MEIQLEKEKLDILAKAVEDAGLYAKEQQGEIHRSYKSDGSVITETDLAISKRILSVVSSLFPEANIISEEKLTAFDPEAPYTFVLDPIDGTDVYSQGLPSWAVALGILDKDRKPVGAYIAAPRWGIGCESLFVRLDPGSELLVNGKSWTLSGDKDRPRQVTMGSSGQRLMDFSRFHGKVRIFGSSILHMLAPVIHSHIQGCVNQSCYVWDIVASHAVLLACGMDIQYVDARPFVYDDSFVLERKPFSPSFYAGTEACRAELARILPATT
ncbi:MAG TPA: inositol monophosphatase family protein [Sphaerochaeta sp.]|nr:inositol monophosphatase family protein [Sphaerochaeta sp.]